MMSNIEIDLINFQTLRGEKKQRKTEYCRNKFEVLALSFVFNRSSQSKLKAEKKKWTNLR